MQGKGKKQKAVSGMETAFRDINFGKENYASFSTCP